MERIAGCIILAAGVALLMAEPAISERVAVPLAAGALPTAVIFVADAPAHAATRALRLRSQDFEPRSTLFGFFGI